MPVRGVGRSLFQCFSSQSPVDPDLKSRWVEAYGRKRITEDEVKAFLKELRAISSIGETHAWINHGSGG